MSERMPSPAAAPNPATPPGVYDTDLPPAEGFPNHHQTAAFVREHDIVTVDQHDRGHRPTWNTHEGNTSGGEYLSYYEMEQIAGNRNQIVNNPPNRSEVPGPGNEDPVPPPGPGEDPAPVPPPGPAPGPGEDDPGDEPTPLPPPAPVPPPGPGEVPGPPEPIPAPGGGGGRGRGPRIPRRPGGGSGSGGSGGGSGRRRGRRFDGGENDPYDDTSFRHADELARRRDAIDASHLGRPSSGPELLDPKTSAHDRARQRAHMPAHMRIKLRRLEEEQAAQKQKEKAAIGRKVRKHALREMNREMDPEDYDRIEVLEEVPWLQSRLLRSKFLSWMARPRYRNESFTLLEYHSGIRPGSREHTLNRGTATGRDRGTLGSIRDVGDRRMKRFVVKEVKKGIIAPHVTRAEDRTHKWLPDARKTTRSERRRRETLITATSGATWEGGLHSQGREAIAVGPDRGLATIGFDARRLRPGTRRHRLREAVHGWFGHDIRITPNAAARAQDELSADQVNEVNNKIRARVAHDRHVRLGLPGRAPVAPPHPHDRRTPRWAGWGAMGRRMMDDRPLPENDRRRRVRPYGYKSLY